MNYQALCGDDDGFNDNTQPVHTSPHQIIAGLHKSLINVTYTFSSCQSPGF